MSLPPSAEPAPSPSRLHTPLRISLWGCHAAPLVDALHAYAMAQPGWTERIEIRAHAPECVDVDWKQWLASERMLRGTPHLSLLVPTDLPARQSSEWLLRTALSDAGMTYQVLYGASIEDRLRNAANAIALTARNILPSIENACFQISESPREQRARLRTWNCEKCSDPECEHKLFTGLRIATERAVSRV